MMPSARPNSSPILPLDSIHATLPIAGGKGANLACLKRALFPVPDGFIITTQAYRDFLAANRLEAQILARIAAVDLEHPDTLEAASQRIRALFSAGAISAAFVGELQAAYRELGSSAVAVRSSATAEDLPELSFAGQQETYLNVLGVERLQQAVVDCWGSLWTARAIGYRLRNAIDQAQVALAVVVQVMVQSEASGVLFTANPLTGLRAEMVIDATLGLGEALVSGQVEPDHYAVDPAAGRILSKMLGAKSLSIHGAPAGGTQVVELSRGAVQALPDEQIVDLAQLGHKAAELFGFPQDIEWAWAEGKLYLLQSRPVTALFPLPENLPAEPLKTLFSFAAVQGMLDPMTPLGRDAIKQIFATASGLFGVRVTPQTQKILYDAGERLWVNFTPILTNSFGRRVVPVVLNLVEPTIRQAVEQIKDDPRLQPGRRAFSMRARFKLVRFFAPLAANIWLNLLSPRRRRESIVDKGEQIITLMERRCAAVHGDRWQKLSQRAALLPDLAAGHLPHTFLLFVSAVAAGMASWNLLNMLAAGAAVGQPEGQPSTNRDLILEVTRGMPFNPTTEMDLALWQMAKTLRQYPTAVALFQNSRPADLAARYGTGELPEEVRQVMQPFLRRYGGRGLGEIDLGRTRWGEDPTHVFEMLSSFLQIEDTTLAPDVVFARGADSAKLAVDALAKAVRQTRHGWLKARQVHFLAGRARQLMGARESPKFFAVRMMWLIQRALRQSGEELVQAGDLDRADDLFYLTLSELGAFAAREEKDWRGLILNRRECYQRELLRRQIPRLLLSDGRAFYAGMNAVETDGDTISGSPVSPGSAQGRVRVVLDPSKAGLLPGEILVCPGTDPSWTPLFLSAAGLVMETGGMMTHGAVVAREYGIPAIVGVDRATQRLHTGELVRMDGSTGVIHLAAENVH
jgi:phosphohistidine swiveling domain-containing protein